MARTLFPAFLDLVGRPVLVVGAGAVAADKISRVLAAGAEVTVIAPTIDPIIARLPVTLVHREFRPEDLDGVWYVVSAAPPAVNAEVAREATARRVFVNAVDDPRHATTFAGSTFQRGPVTVAISTGGEAPALARVLREALERLIGRDVEAWTALTRRLRREWKADEVPIEQRRDALLAELARMHEEATRPMQRGGPGLVSLVGAGPGDPELLTRLAARRLAEADVVLYDALVSPAVLSLATRAQLVLVGRRSGSSTLGQVAINRTLVRAARRGRRVVRLKGGDPFLFGRGGEEALALAEAGVAFEIVPGISSALAAPALASIPVTHRGLSGSVLITSGHDLERFGRLVRDVAPGAATLVVLMGGGNRAGIQRLLLAEGWPRATPAAILWSASLPRATSWFGPLDQIDRSNDSDDPVTIVIGEVVAVREALNQRYRETEMPASRGVRHG